MLSEKVLMALIGLVAGMLVCCCSGGVLLAVSSGSPEIGVTALPATGTIEADLAEAYLNRTFLDNTRAYPSPWPIQAGQLDVRPGNRMDFVVQVASPIGPLTINGIVTLAAREGRLVIRLADVRMGALPVTALAPIFQPDIEARINEQANRQLEERTALAKVQLVGVTSDDTQLRFFLAGK